jgi:hypothetical protein
MLTTKMSTTPPPSRQYSTPRDSCVFVAGKTVTDGSEDETGEICVPSSEERVTVKMGFVPLPGTPVVVNVQEMVSTVGLAEKPAVCDASM